MSSLCQPATTSRLAGTADPAAGASPRTPPVVLCSEGCRQPRDGGRASCPTRRFPPKAGRPFRHGRARVWLSHATGVAATKSGEGGQCSGGSVSPPRGTRGRPQPLRPRASRRHSFFFFCRQPPGCGRSCQKEAGGTSLGWVPVLSAASHAPPGGMPIGRVPLGRRRRPVGMHAPPPPVSRTPSSSRLPLCPAVALPPLLPYPMRITPEGNRVTA